VAGPQADVELLAFGYQLLQELGIADDATLELNTLGDPETREVWRASLIDYFEGHAADLSKESKDRLQRNPLRILDSKDPTDKAICANAPRVDDCLTPEAADFFASVAAGIDAAGVPWKRNPRLVRGLDYYRHTAFEFVTNRLGAQGTVIAGGRYDGLIESLGGPYTPAVGWAAGIERLAMMIGAPEPERPQVALVVENVEREPDALKILAGIRHSGISAELFASGSPRKRYDKALKADPAMAISFDIRDGAPGRFNRLLRPEDIDVARVQAVLDAVELGA
jgi:histidyl-tRNA synthetase